MTFLASACCTNRESQPLTLLQSNDKAALIVDFVLAALITTVAICILSQAYNTAFIMIGVSCGLITLDLFILMVQQARHITKLTGLVKFEKTQFSSTMDTIQDQVDKDNKTHKTEIARLQGTITQKNQEVKELTTDLTNARGALNATREALTASEATKRIATAEVTTLKGQLSKAEAKIVTLEHEALGEESTEGFGEQAASARAFMQDTGN